MEGLCWWLADLQTLAEALLQQQAVQHAIMLSGGLVPREDAHLGVQIPLRLRLSPLNSLHQAKP